MECPEIVLQCHTQKPTLSLFSSNATIVGCAENNSVERVCVTVYI